MSAIPACSRTAGGRGRDGHHDAVRPPPRPLRQQHRRLHRVAVQNTNGGALAYSGMLFYDHTGALTQFQGFNNSTHEYRINNIARVSPGGAFNGSIHFMIGGSPKFVVAPNGNVGIGTAAPSQKLHVAGDVAVDGNIISGKFNIERGSWPCRAATTCLWEPDRVRRSRAAAATRSSAPVPGLPTPAGLPTPLSAPTRACRTRPDNRIRFLVSRRARRIRAPRGTPSSDRAPAD